MMVETWPGRMNASILTSGSLTSAAERERHRLVCREDAEVLEALLLGAKDGRGDERDGGLEADGDEDDLLVGLLLGERERVERGVDDADVAPVGLLAWRASE